MHSKKEVLVYISYTCHQPWDQSSRWAGDLVECGACHVSLAAAGSTRTVTAPPGLLRFWDTLHVRAFKLLASYPVSLALGQAACSLLKC